MSSRPSLWFRAVGLAATVFIITIFVMIAGLFSDPKLPLNLWLNLHGISLLFGEVGLLIAFGMLAMLTDRASRSNSDRRTEMTDEGATPALLSDS
jgi:hypothetical protein